MKTESAKESSKDLKVSKGIEFKLEEDERKRVVESLNKKLKLFKEHRNGNYEDNWDKWERIIRGVYKNQTNFDAEGKPDWKSKVYYKIANQKRLSAIAQIRDAKPNGDKLPLDLDPPTVKKTSDEQDIDDTLEMLNLGDDYMLDKHRKALDDHLTFSKSNTEFNKVIDDMSTYGAGVFLSPYIFEDYSFEYTAEIKNEPPAIENQEGVITEEGKKALSEWVKGNVFPSRKVKKEIRVGVKHIPLRNFFPDPSCLGDGQKGMGHFVREYLSVKTIMMEVEKGNFDKEVALKMLKKYDESSKDQFNHENQSAENTKSTNRYENDMFKGIPVYTYYGDILMKDFKLFKNEEVDTEKSEEEELSEFETVQVQIIMTEDDGFLKARENPYPTKRRPIHIIPWEVVQDEWCGRGIPEKIEHLQQALNTVINVWIDQSELAGSGMLAVNIKDLDEDENLDIYPGKVIYTKGDKPIRDILEQFSITDTSAGLINTLGQIMQMIDYESGVPKIIEGQGDVNAKTAYETQQQEAHALKQLGIVIDNIDVGLAVAGEMINEHMIIYDAEEHDFFGDYRVVARGYATFEQKTVRMKELEMGIQDFLQNEHAQMIIKGAEMMREKYRLMSPSNLDFIYTDDEIEENKMKKAEQEQQAMMMELEKQKQLFQHQTQLEQMKAQAKVAEAQGKAQSDAVIQDSKQEHEAEENQKDRNLEKEKMAIDIEEKRDDREIKTFEAISKNKPEKKESPSKSKKK